MWIWWWFFSNSRMSRWGQFKIKWKPAINYWTLIYGVANYIDRKMECCFLAFLNNLNMVVQENEIHITRKHWLLPVGATICLHWVIIMQQQWLSALMVIIILSNRSNYKLVSWGPSVWLWLVLKKMYIFWHK